MDPAPNAAASASADAAVSFATYQYGTATLRIRSSDLKTSQHWLGLFSVIWTALSALLLAIAIWAWLSLNVWLIRASAFAVVVPPIAFGIKVRCSLSLFPAIQLFSIAVLLGLCSVNAELHLCSYMYMCLPTALCWLVCIYFCNYRAVTKLVLIVLLLQLFLAVLKLDGILIVQWDSVLLPMFASLTVLYFCSGLLGIGFLVALCKPNLQYAYRRAGYGYVSGCSMMGALPLTFVVLIAKAEADASVLMIKIGSVVGCLICLFPAVCYFCCQTSLLVFFSTSTPNDSKQPLQLKPYLKEVPLAGKLITLKQISSNYYSLEGSEQPSETSIPLHDNVQHPTCTICLSEPSDVVGLPCGHLASCFSCLKYYVDRCNNKCLICKRDMEQVYRVEKYQDRPNQVVVQANYLISFR